MANPEALLQEAKTTLRDEHNTEKARDLFLQVATLKNIPLAQWSAEAQQLMHEGNTDAATQLFVQIIEHNPTDIPALIGLARASIYMSLLDEAEAYLQGVFRMDPDNAEAHTFQGLVHEGRQQFQEALDHLNVAAERAPNLFAAHYNLGRVLLQVGEDAPAVAALTHSTELEPENYFAFYILGMAYKQAGYLREAIISFNRAMQIDPDTVDIYATLADVLVEVGDKSTAMDVLNTGLNRCNEHPSLLEKSAAICLQEGKMANAIEYFEAITEQLPSYERAWINLANLYVLTEDLEKSEAAGKKAIEVSPEGWEGYYHLGNLYETVGSFDQAEDMYKQSVQNAPQGEFRPMGNLGALYLEMDDVGKNQESIEIFKRVLPLVPAGDFRFHYNLALAHAKLGEKSTTQRLIKEIREGAHPEDELLDAVNALENNVFSVQDQVKMNIALGALRVPAPRIQAEETDENKDDDK